MKVGITLPTFEPGAAFALATAQAAERAGLDGVFAFDHLWPGEDRSRPSLSIYPVLGAVGAATVRIALGPLVARIGLVPDDVVVESLLSVSEMTGGRLIAAVGVGDQKSAEENRAYGIEWAKLADRRRSLALVLGELAAHRVEAWVGASAPATIQLARGAGVTVNLWNADPDRLRAEALEGPTTWAGPLPRTAEAAAGRLLELCKAGATWAVWGWPSSIELVSRALQLAGMQAGR